jgi:ribosomal peptide maturation radical SAM protein 1
MKTNSPILLVSMPFAPLYAPSLGLSLLQGQLRRVGVQADIRYFSIDFARRIGEELYSRIAEGFPSTLALVGEWLFSHALFRKTTEDMERFVREVIRSEADSQVTTESLESFISEVLQVRSAVIPFLNDTAEQVAAAGCQIVGFTSVFQQHIASVAVAKQVKAIDPDAYIVFGGANCEAPMAEENLRQFPWIDAVVSGEGELAFQQLVLDFLSCRNTERKIPAVYRRQSSLIKLGAPHPQMSSSAVDLPHRIEMDDLPFPDYSEFMDQAKDADLNVDRIRLLFESARGCWWGEKHHCTFCGLNGGTMPFRSKSAPRALEEIKWLYERFGVQKFSAADNILDPRYFETFLPSLARAGLPVELFYEVKANLKKKHIRILRDAGVTSLQPGIESLSNEVLGIMRKGVTALQNLQTLKWCKEFGIEVAWNLLWGFPGESPTEYEAMARLVPLCEHLPPPLGVRRIRMDRFSPMFFDSDRLGFSDVRAAAAYRHIYPFSDSVLLELAYYFDYECESQETERLDVSNLTGAVEDWDKAFEGSDLLAIDKGAAIVIIDLRAVAVQKTFVFRGLERALLLACDAIHSSEALAKTTTQDLGFDTVPFLQSALQHLISLGLVISDGRSFLGLPVFLGEYSPKTHVINNIADLLQVDEVELSQDIPSFGQGRVKSC